MHARVGGLRKPNRPFPLYKQKEQDTREVSAPGLSRICARGGGRDDGRKTYNRRLSHENRKAGHGHTHSPFRTTEVGATNPEASETRHRATSTTNALKAMVIGVQFG